MPLLSQTTSIAAHQGTSTTLSCLSLDNPPLQHNALLQRCFQTLSMHNRPTKSRGNFNKLFFRWNYRVTGIFFFSLTGTEGFLLTKVAGSLERSLKEFHWGRGVLLQIAHWIFAPWIVCDLPRGRFPTTGGASQCHIYPALNKTFSKLHSLLLAICVYPLYF